MRYRFNPDDTKTYEFGMFAKIYDCPNHKVCNKATLYEINGKGILVIQQYFIPEMKCSYWSNIDPRLTKPIYLHKNFKCVFDKYASEPHNGLYPTLTIRQLMHAMRMKPLERQYWETYFDKKLL